MKLIDKYLLREFLLPVFYCLAAFSMIFIVLDLFDHITDFLEAKTPISLVLRYYLCVLAPGLEYLAPASLLLATLYTLWQLSRNNELTAMRATGVSMYRLLIPFLGVGLVFSLAALVVKEAVAPASSRWADEFRENDMCVVENRTQYNQRFYNAAGLRQWHIGRFDLDRPGELERVEIDEENSEGIPVRSVLAKRALWLDGEWWLFSMAEQEYTEEGYPKGPLKRWPGSEFGKAQPFLTETPEDFVGETKDWAYFSTPEMIRYVTARPDLSAIDIQRRWFDVHSRLAMPWACLIVTLFGIPAGAAHGRQSALTGIFMAIAFFFGFYAMMQVGILLGKGGVIWPWAGAWLSNVAFFGAGIYMMKNIA